MLTLVQESKFKFEPTGQLEWSQTLLEGRQVKNSEIKEAVEALGDGWRVPTLRELFSIVDHARREPAIDTEKFPDTQLKPYWTSTTCAWDDKAHWIVYFYHGTTGCFDRGNHTACLRACRTRQ